MSEKEISRYDLMHQVKLKKLNQVKAAELLGITDRHFRRLWKSYQKEGPSALISKKRGKPSNNRKPPKLKEKVIGLAKGTYLGCGPSFICDKLVEEHQLKVSVETLRKWMIEANIWEARAQRRPKIHQSRQRRSQIGDLIQMDGSPHDWFEGRRERCCLLGFIDDATSMIMHLKFVEAETTASYFTALREYFDKHGRPQNFYCDRFSVFRVNNDKAGYKKSGLTQVGRALKELDVGLICANSPQAKGRIERLFGVLQDRLIKELRLKGISTLEEANNYICSYIEKHNSKFSVKPEKEGNLHRKLLREHKMDRILCYKEERTLSKNLEISYGQKILQIKTERPTYAMRGAKVQVLENLEGKVIIGTYLNKIICQ